MKTSELTATTQSLRTLCPSSPRCSVQGLRRRSREGMKLSLSMCFPEGSFFEVFRKGQPPDATSRLSSASEKSFVSETIGVLMHRDLSQSLRVGRKRPMKCFQSVVQFTVSSPVSNDNCRQRCVGSIGLRVCDGKVGSHADSHGIKPTWSKVDSTSAQKSRPFEHERSKPESEPLCVHMFGRCGSQAEFCVLQALACMNKLVCVRDGKKVTS
ncbi:hypothetical protein KCV03_g59, partial [Aureobasidium melanogenum]